MEADEVRRIIREELDRKPEGWQAYAEACCAYMDHQTTYLPSAHEAARTAWGTQSFRLEQAALALRPKP